MIAADFILWVLLVFDPFEREWVVTAESNDPEYLMEYAIYHEVHPDDYRILLKGIES